MKRRISSVGDLGSETWLEGLPCFDPALGLLVELVVSFFAVRTILKALGHTNFKVLSVFSAAISLLHLVNVALHLKKHIAFPLVCFVATKYSIKFSCAFVLVA